jgi:hypothetical protein
LQAWQAGLVAAGGGTVPAGDGWQAPVVPFDTRGGVMSRICLAFLTTLIAGLTLAKEEPPPALDKAAAERARRPIVMVVHGGVPPSLPDFVRASAPKFNAHPGDAIPTLNARLAPETA